MGQKGDENLDLFVCVRKSACEVDVMGSMMKMMMEQFLILSGKVKNKGDRPEE